MRSGTFGTIYRNGLNIWTPAFAGVTERRVSLCSVSWYRRWFMEKKEKVLLCKLDLYCPSVELQSDGNITIGEDANTVKLTREQWNILVEKVQDGTLKKI